MRVLILSCNTGQGHNSTAASIQEALAERGAVCDLRDALAFVARWLSRLVCAAHTFVYRHVPGLFRWGYAYTERHRGVFAPNSIVCKILSRSADRLSRFCRENAYDVIICTHVFAGLIVTMMQEKYHLPLRAYSVETDYTCSPCAEQSKTERYFIPAEHLVGEFIKCGIPKQRIVASGLPIHREFFNHTDRQEAKSAMGIPADHSHLILMCGSMGCGPMKALVRLFNTSLKDHQDVTVICGTNRRLYRRLSRRYGANSRIHIRQYVQDISLLMDSADLYLTKPGGISVTEAAAKGLPMVFIDAVAGCEEYNMHYFIQRGAAVTARTPAALASLCLSLLSDPELLAQMSAAAKNASCGDGAKRISDLVWKDYLSGISPVQPCEPPEL